MVANTSHRAVKALNTLQRKFSASKLTPSEFAAIENISKSSIYRRLRSSHHGHRTRGRRPSLASNEFGALNEKIAIAQTSGNALSLPSVMETAASIADSRGTPFQGGFPSKNTAKKIVKV